MTARRGPHLRLIALVLVLCLAGCGPGQPSGNPPSGAATVPTPSAGPSVEASISGPPASATATAAFSTIDVELLPVRLPVPLSRAVAFASAGQILVCGGLLASGTTTAAIVRVDPAAGVATTIGNLAVGVHDAAGAAVGGRNLVFGGGNATPLAVIQTCEPSSPSRVVGELPSPRADVSAVTATLPDGSVEAIVVGGAGGSLQPAVLATTSGAAVTEVARLAAAVRYAAVVSMGSSVVAIGGFRDGADVSDIQQIDLSTGETRIVGHLATPLAHAAAFLLDGQLVIAGGIRDGHWQRTIWTLDPATWAVTRLGSLPAPRSDAASVVVDGAAYLIGGEGPAGTTATILELGPR